LKIATHYSVITELLPTFLFDSHFKDQQNTRRWLLKDHQAATLPLRLQAYERMTLFMERINPSH
jgi:hypothetical protein